MDGLAVLIVLVVIIALAFLILRSSRKPSIDDYHFPYRKCDALFTPAERSFLGVLMQVVGHDAQVFGKVRIADVLTPKKGITRSRWQTSFNKISAKHFDYVLCDTHDLSVLCVIELNDRSHESKNRQERDAFVEGACRVAGLPLIQIPAKSSYRSKDVRAMVEPFMPHHTSAQKKKHKHQDTEKEQEKYCPKCAKVLVKQVAKKGQFVGCEFWGCSAFPKCRYIESING